MKTILSALEKSIRHLRIIDQVFAKRPHSLQQRYLEAREKIKKASKGGGFLRFADEFYVGGKKGGEDGYGRQMILSDIFEYIVNGRGYYFADRKAKDKSLYIKIILHLVNQLTMWDSLTVNQSLRKKVLLELEGKIGKRLFFKEVQMQKNNSDLIKYRGDIGFDVEGSTLSSEDESRLNEYFDSILPKTAGGLWNELLIFVYLLRLNVGYIVPLLLNQRLLSLEDSLVPPDFLLISYLGDIFGIEVGGRKERQSSLFQQQVRGIRMLTTENPFIPRRCPICGMWTAFCDKVINDFAEFEKEPLLHIRRDIRCAHDCSIYNFNEVVEGKCPYIQYRGPISSNRQTKQTIRFRSEYHYHYSCILACKDRTALKKVQDQVKRTKKHLEKHGEDPGTCTHDRMKIGRLKANYPYVVGLEMLERPSKERLFCYGYLRNDRNCAICEFVIDCKRVTKLRDILESDQTTDRKDLISEIERLMDPKGFNSI